MKYQHGADDGGEDKVAGVAGVAFDLRVAGSGEVAEDDEPGAPDEPPGGVEGEKSAVGQAGGAGQARHDSAEERGEPMRTWLEPFTMTLAETPADYRTPNADRQVDHIAANGLIILATIPSLSRFEVA